ncbi:MAG TPA: hypothetical protein VNE62_05910 [Actinomycetota bacterium]|nr:hypothetical protein [Actinomycetota bacterium]
MADGYDEAAAAEVEQRLGRSFEAVQRRLEDLFGSPWEDVETIIETAAGRGGRSRADVIVDLVGRTERRTPVLTQVRRSVIQWVGKPWREREDPWSRLKDRVPPPRSIRPPEPDDLEEWKPLRPEER